MPKRLDVLVCGGGSCISSHSHEIKDKLINVLEEKGLMDEVNVVETGCMGPCELGPVMVVYPDGAFYIKIKEEDIEELVEEHFYKGRPLKRLLWETPEARRIVEEKKQVPFFEKQKKIVLSNCGKIDPENIEEYISQKGYEALGKALTDMNRDEVIETMIKSGLRGRGGAGFPTGLKWKFTKAAEGEQKYVVCNADEGDPGAFMDRAVLEGDPHAVLEGMAIAGYAIGADKGYIYVRAEYPLAISRLEIAIKQAKELGLLGNNIFETDFSFDIELRMGAGAFVCGEETALLASIEGERGQPRPKPPFPAQKGLWGKPTLINNVETFANIRHILNNGSDWFASIGTEKSKGTKVFALSGNVRNTGLVEVPMGITLGELIYDIGGGIPNDKKFKAVQSGGPSGGCIPKEYLNTSIDYESLKELGAIMGSGGMIVLDEDTCMVNIAKFFLEFTIEESCGQCSPCRIGLKQMHAILDRITKGEGKLEDIDKLIELGNAIKETSLCGLGQSAPNPVLSTIRYFRDEYIEHIVEKKCSAGVCATLFYAPCQNTCPSNVDAARYIGYMGEGELEKAYLTHMKNNPFPSACARVCPAFCEQKCERGKFDEPIAIREVKRVFADWALEHAPAFKPPENPKKEKIAIVGAGPAGLACGFYLTRMGYKPVVFESLPVAGGMMTVGIPEYRLPKKYIEKEVKVIEEAGVEIRLNTKVESLEKLKADGFNAIFIGTGAHTAREMKIKGEDAEGVITGIDFLRKINLGENMEVGDNVIVIGGGSTATDAARTALRLGAKNVKIVYRRTKAEMPALREEIIESEEEGIEMEFLTNPIEIIKDEKGKVKAMKFIRTELGDFDSSGRRRPVPVAGTEWTMKADLIIPCIGQKLTFGKLHVGLELEKNGHIKIDPETMMTSEKGIFAGGDAYYPSTVIEAVAQGRKAAIEIDKFLGYSGELFTDERGELENSYDEDKYLKVLPRRKPDYSDIEKRIRDMVLEVNKGLSLDDAIEEARRCLHCDKGKSLILEKSKDKVEKKHLKLEEML
jgi:NADH-quinone oxidoreductase subunit F